MPRFAANLSLLYTELPFLDRFAAAARDGFRAVECLFPYEHSVQALSEQLRAHALQQVLFNAPPGDWELGERGLAALVGREDEFRASVEQALVYARDLPCRQVHVLAGCLPVGADRADARRCYVSNLTWAANQAQKAGVVLLIEPINPRDMPGYFLNRQADAHAIVCEVNSAHLRVQMDLYHCQIVEGDLTSKLREYLPSGRVAHLQIAGVPTRNEPDVGEVNYSALFAEIDALGYTGYIGCEYRPRAGTSAGLGWLRALDTR